MTNCDDDDHIRRLESLSDAELDAELLSFGIDPDELNRKMLARLLEERLKGHDTPMLNEAIRQFDEATR